MLVEHILSRRRCRRVLPRRCCCCCRRRRMQAERRPEHVYIIRLQLVRWRRCFIKTTTQVSDNAATHVSQSSACVCVCVIHCEVRTAPCVRRTSTLRHSKRTLFYPGNSARDVNRRPPNKQAKRFASGETAAWRDCLCNNDFINLLMLCLCVAGAQFGVCTSHTARVQCRRNNRSVMWDA